MTGGSFMDEFVYSNPNLVQSGNVAVNEEVFNSFLARVAHWADVRDGEAVLNQLVVVNQESAKRVVACGIFRIKEVIMGSKRLDNFWTFYSPDGNLKSAVVVSLGREEPFSCDQNICPQIVDRFRN
ncbi:hypothetical protein PanWU01x14_199310 [Parasponia andersonii]|uniref:Uncharacterized protein n=1 Tax=Parasponia andersonii TaxID=3476 RepID=A0A2P5BYD2_PARAD|nr:hypothetical protein PanWU01x14_199310 [Parasponia andersonii]